MKKKKILIIIILLATCFIFLSSVIFSLINMPNNNIISGITINNINVSKKNKEKTSELFHKLIDKKNKSTIKLQYTDKAGNYEKTLDLSILNLDYHLSDSINVAYNYGRGKNIFQNNFDIANALFKHKNFDLNITYDEKMLNNVIADISSNLPGKMIQSSYYIENDNLIVTKGSAGIIVDNEVFVANLKNILSNLAEEDLTMQIPVKYTEPNSIDLNKIHSEIYKEPKDAYFEKEPFKVYAEVKGIDFDIERAKNEIEKSPNKSEYTIKLEHKEPKIKLKNLDINVFPDELSTFSTNYNPDNKDRTTNLKLAASKIYGTILSPGEEFSYNKIVGERSISAGYKEAKVYQGGQIVDGLGGGICQISSTLYNAVVFANLKVTERFNHQFITSYVNAGRDATVAYGSKDFKFINNRTYPIRIDVTINSGIAKVDIYGIKEKKEYSIAIDTEIVSNIPFETKYETDSSLPVGTEKVKQRGVNGIIVNAFKVIKQNGVTVSRELLSKDTYNALNRIILKN